MDNNNYNYEQAPYNKIITNLEDRQFPVPDFEEISNLAYNHDNDLIIDNKSNYSTEYLDKYLNLTGSPFDAYKQLKENLVGINTSNAEFMKLLSKNLQYYNQQVDTIKKKIIEIFDLIKRLSGNSIIVNDDELIKNLMSIINRYLETFYGIKLAYDQLYANNEILQTELKSKGNTLFTSIAELNQIIETNLEEIGIFNLNSSDQPPNNQGPNNQGPNNQGPKYYTYNQIQNKINTTNIVSALNNANDTTTYNNEIKQLFFNTDNTSKQYDGVTTYNAINSDQNYKNILKKIMEAITPRQQNIGDRFLNGVQQQQQEKLQQDEALKQEENLRRQEKVQRERLQQEVERERLQQEEVQRERLREQNIRLNPQNVRDFNNVGGKNTKKRTKHKKRVKKTKRISKQFSKRRKTKASRSKKV